MIQDHHKIKSITIRGVEIGTGMPKICVPIVGQTKEDILRAAEAILGVQADIVEWRVDWFEHAYTYDKVIEVLTELRQVLAELPILFTFRTLSEGGEKEIETKTYVELLKVAMGTNAVDLVDVELFMGDTVVKELVSEAHQREVKVVASNHDFAKTPEKEEIIARLCKMQELNADLLKIAVMPQNKKDVLTLLEATEEMVMKHAVKPVVTISMGEDGCISRIVGEMVGSAITFGTVGQESAPGQISVEKLSWMLKALHENI